MPPVSLRLPAATSAALFDPPPAVTLPVAVSVRFPTVVSMRMSPAVVMTSDCGPTPSTASPPVATWARVSVCALVKAKVVPERPDRELTRLPSSRPTLPPALAISPFAVTMPPVSLRLPAAISAALFAPPPAVTLPAAVCVRLPAVVSMRMSPAVVMTSDCGPTPSTASPPSPPGRGSASAHW